MEQKQRIINCQQADPLAEDLQFCASQEKEVSSEQEEEEEKTEKNREGEGEDLEYEEEGKGELKEIVSGKDLAPHAQYLNTVIRSMLGGLKERTGWWLVPL